MHMQLTLGGGIVSVLITMSVLVGMVMERGGWYRGEVSVAMMAALGLDVGAHLTAEERFKQVAAVMKRRDAQDRKEQRTLRRQQKLDKKVSASIMLCGRPLPAPVAVRAGLVG